jgi:type VI secretion system secreted protein VgrG
MKVTEGLGRMFEMDLEFLSTNNNVALESVVGQPFSVHLETYDRHDRHFHGLATRLSHIGTLGRHARYRAIVNPWLWMLTRTADCRIFQEKSVPDIIMEVFRDEGFTDFKDSLTGTYPTHEYCVQYRESDFNFVSRLMEHAGIYYFFEHERGKHTLVLADSYSAHSKASGYEDIPFYPPDVRQRRDSEHFEEVTISQQVQPGSYVVDSFDFKKPRAELQANSVKPRPHDHSDSECFDFPVDYTESSDGDTYARVRLDEFQARHEILESTGNACGVGCGNLFNLTGHLRHSLNKEYLITSSVHDIVMHGYESGFDEGEGLVDTIWVEAIESKQKFQTSPTTPKPTIQGPQTAIVVGKKGEEIWTEEHGRVKVQFHWDRQGKRDENSSCWIRVAQVWAGKGWGGIWLPRIGQEVIVQFMSGDPDQPIVTGSVYNGDQKVPYELPANQTQSGVKSRSTKQGTAENFNEIRFEDKKGAEEIFIRAERDQNTLVKRKLMETIEDTADHSVKKGRRTTIGATDHYHVKAGRNEKVDGKQSLTVGGDQNEKVGKDHALDAGNEIHLKAGMKVIIEAGMQLSLKAAGGFIDIGPAGVTIQGTLVNINSGGSAGAGGGSSPTKPDDAEEVTEE